MGDFKDFQKMPHIADPDALDRMARVEGERWKELQLRNRTSPFGFFAYFGAWNYLVKERYVGEASPHEVIGMGLLPGLKGTGDGTIYGEGGYSRYKVDMNGGIHFDYGIMLSNERRAKARTEGYPP